jgi:hypothetical protein
MRNILTIDANNTAIYTCLENIDAGINEIILIIRRNNTTNPKIQINHNDPETLNFENGIAKYNLALNLLDVSFKIIDDNYTSRTFRILKIGNFIPSRIQTFGHTIKMYKHDDSGYVFAIKDVYTINPLSLEYLNMTYEIDCEVIEGEGDAVTNNDTAIAGTNITIIDTPNDGYEYAGAIVKYPDDTVYVTLDSNTKYFTMPESDVTVQVSFIKSTFDLSYNITTGQGTVTLPSQTATYGSLVSFSVFPGVGYYYYGGYYTYSLHGTVNQIGLDNTSFYMPPANTTINIIFARSENNINVQIENAKIELSTNIARYGDTVIYIVTPDKGYEYLGGILYWTVEGVEYSENVVNDTFEMPAADSDVTLSISTTKIFYDITTESKVTVDGSTWTIGGGTVTTDLQHCNMGDQVHIIVTETAEYKLQSLEAVEDPDIIPTDPPPKVQISHDTGYWFTMPAENVKVTGYFVGKVYKVTVSSAEHGSPTVDKNEVQYGQKVTISPNPKAGYSLNSITVVTSQGTSVLVNQNHEFYMPADDVTVTVTYTARTYNITLSQQTGGTISAPQTATVDSNVTVTVTPTTDYELDYLTVTKSGGGNVSVTEDNKFIMPAANVTITPTFKLKHEIDHVVRFSTNDPTVGDVRIYRKDHTMMIFQGDISTDSTTNTKRIDNVVITESTWL